MRIKRFHRPLIGAAAVVAAAVSIGAVRSARAAQPDATARAGGVTIVADLSQRRLYVKNGDSVVESFAVAVGKGSKPTPAGSYSIRKIVWNPAWIPPDEPWAKNKKPQPPGSKSNPMQLVKIFFKEPDYYIHGTNEVESVGEAASHGCLRMDPNDAYQVARYLMEHAGQPHDDSWYQNVLNDRSQTETIILKQSVPMTVTE